MQFADFYTPIPQADTNLLSGMSGINAFRQGKQDQLAQNQRNLLKDVGGQAATGNYLQAAQTAMRGGDLDTGLALTKYKTGVDAADFDKRLKLFDFAGRGMQAADTPEKLNSLVDMMQGVYGPDTDLSQFRDFSKRDQYMSFISDKKSELERQKLQTDIELSREKLTGEREARGFKRDVLSNFGFVPGGTPASSYGAPRAEAAPQNELEPPLTAAGPEMMSPPTVQSAAPPSTRDVIARMSPTQRSALGLLLSKEDYAGAVKLLQEAAGDAEGKPPSGYKWSTTRPGEQEAIPGGPASKLPADVAGKVGMMRVGIGNLPKIRDIFLGPEGDIDPKTGKPTRKGSNVGMFDYYTTRGAIGEGVRLTTGAIESVLRAASGAAVPEQEVTRYQGLFLPSPYDTEQTKARKLDALENWMGTMLSTIQEGRPVPLDEAHRLAQARARTAPGPNAPPGATGQIPPDAVRELRADPSPEARREFEEAFGVSADQFLQGR